MYTLGTSPSELSGESTPAIQQFENLTHIAKIAALVPYDIVFQDERKTSPVFTNLYALSMHCSYRHSLTAC